MPADATIQNALIVIAVAVSVQTVLLLCTVIAMSVAWKRAQVMLNAQLNHFGERLDDMATQTRIAVDAIERSSSQVNSMLHDAGGLVRNDNSARTPEVPKAECLRLQQSSRSAIVGM